MKKSRLIILIISVILAIFILFFIYNYIIVEKYNLYVSQQNQDKKYCNLDSDCYINDYPGTYGYIDSCFNFNEEPKDYLKSFKNIFTLRKILVMRLPPVTSCKCVNQQCVDCHNQNCTR